MSTAANRRVRPLLEQLESRETPAQLRGDVVFVEGTAAADVIRISERDGILVVRVNGGAAEGFARTPTTTVRVEAGGGNDLVVGPASSSLSLLVEGGAGGDTILGGGGDDDLDGGSGNDSVRGGGGNDVVAGGDGNDALFGDRGGDTVLGGRGDDLLEGGGGPDRMDGGTGNDQLRGEGSADILLSGTGVNTLSGGGRDRFITVDEFETDVNRYEDFTRGVDRRKTTFADPFLLGARTDLFPGGPSVNDRRHLDGPINYAALGSTNPPAFGPHHPAPVFPTGVFGTPLDDADLVHNLEHGHVNIVYDPARLSAADVAALERMVRQFGPRSGIVLAPRRNNPTAVAATSWAHLITLDRIDLRFLRAFLLVNRGYGPEGFITP